MKEEWLFPNTVVPVDAETTAALVAEIKRLIDVVGGMALAQPERPWKKITDEERASFEATLPKTQEEWDKLFNGIEAIRARGNT